MVARRLSVAVLVAVSVSSESASARELVLQPTSKWEMHYADDSCALGRSFGEGDNQIIAQFIRYEPGAIFDFHLIGKPLKSRETRFPASVRFGTSGKFLRTTTTAGAAGNIPALFLSGRLDNLDTSDMDRSDYARMTDAERAAFESIPPEVEAAVTSVTIRLRGNTIALQLGSMAAPMAAMRKCTTDLVKLWGFDPERQENLASMPRPKSDPQSWLQNSDYPANSLKKGQQSIVRFRLMVDSAGQPTDCVIQQAFSKGDFEEATCAGLMKRARFEPARLQDGTAVASYFVSSVHWILN